MNPHWSWPLTSTGISSYLSKFDPFCTAPLNISSSLSDGAGGMYGVLSKKKKKYCYKNKQSVKQSVKSINKCAILIPFCFHSLSSQAQSYIQWQIFTHKCYFSLIHWHALCTLHSSVPHHSPLSEARKWSHSLEDTRKSMTPDLWKEEKNVKKHLMTFELLTFT